MFPSKIIFFFFALAGLALAADPPSESSEADDFENPPQRTVGNKILVLGTFRKMTWFEADSTCKEAGMSLAAIESLAEQDAMIRLIVDEAVEQQNENFWLAGTDKDDEGNFIWSTTGRRFAHSHWVQGQPDNGEGYGENCVHVWQGAEKDFKWNDNQCSEQMFFLCEKRVSGNSTVGLSP